MKAISNSPFEINFLKSAVGFHRLAINGLNNESNQPIVYNDIALICNGEIYNYKKIYEWMNIKPITDSDCEVIIYLYIKYGIEQTLIMLDGVYSFILFDFRINDHNTSHVFIARDPLGVRPLYKLYNNNSNLFNLYGFASELKCLEHFYNETPDNYYIDQFEPGTYSVFEFKIKCILYLHFLIPD